MTEPDDALRTHIDSFNAAVRGGGWTDFSATFADDAVMAFVGVPVGPYVGREAIAEAYRERPPVDTITVTSVRTLAPDTASALFRWDSGGTGSMTVRWFRGSVAELTVVFDEDGQAG
ncbi:nuclear transport factor 2 family protein [Catellatospora paridis]|uniref:nuclear transport factor 2 family protein n=1 Tax=Catellatospora paridis TaxID=1617086 RepID=UPI0012D375B8|nr:nuclear transport factor 2 family protein [Catellatospora paridis]